MIALGSAKQETATAGSRAFRILLVEDDRDFRDCLRSVFLDRGFEVETAGNGWIAVEMAFRTHFDAVVTDVRMGRMDGLALARSLRSRLHPPVVVVLTAFPDWAVMDEALRTGVAEVLVKPVNLRGVVDRVEAHLRAAARTDPPVHRNTTSGVGGGVPPRTSS